MDLDFSTLIIDDDDEIGDSLIEDLSEYSSDLGLKLKGLNLCDSDSVFYRLNDLDLSEFDLILIDLNFGTQPLKGDDNLGKEYVDFIRKQCHYTPIIFYTGNSISDLKKYDLNGIYYSNRRALKDNAMGFIKHYSDNLIIKNTFRNYGCFFEYCTHKYLSENIPKLTSEKKIELNKKILKKIDNKKKSIDKSYEMVKKTDFSYDIFKNSPSIFDHSFSVRTIKNISDLINKKIALDYNTYKSEVIDLRNDFSHNNYKDLKDYKANYRLNYLQRNLSLEDIYKFRRVLLRYKDLFGKL